MFKRSEMKKQPDKRKFVGLGFGLGNHTSWKARRLQAGHTQVACPTHSTGTIGETVNHESETDSLLSAFTNELHKARRKTVARRRLTYRRTRSRRSR